MDLVRRIALSSATALICLLASCSKQPTRVEIGNRTQTLHKGNGTEPQDLDPQIITGQPEHNICMALFEGLVSEDPKDLHPVPGVAERWDISPDGTVYTFHLRKNAKWSNGDTVTARDFVESFHRILLPSLGAEYSYMLYPVKNAEEFNTGKIKDFNEVGFKVIDDFTLQITLHSSTPYFLSLLEHSSWYPVQIETIKKHGAIDDRTNPWTRPKNFVGNGPFRLKEWKVNSYVLVEKNPDYWDAANVKLNQIYFYPIESPDVEERAFRSGQLHLTLEVPQSKISVYREKWPQFIHTDPNLATYFYRFNVTKPPLNDKRVRQALVRAIDREDLVKYVTRGGQLPAYNYTPPDTGGYNARARIDGRIAEAKKLLAEAGYPDGKNFPPITILFNTSEGHKSIAEAIQQMWAKNLSINVSLRNEEWKVFLDSSKNLDYQVCRAGWNGDYADPNNFLDMWVTGGGNNETGWSNKEYDELIRKASFTSDPQKRLELFQKAEAILMDELPIMPIYFYTRSYLKQPSVKGYYPTILDLHPYKYISLEPNS